MGSERVCMFAVVCLIAGAAGDRLLRHALTKRPLHLDFSFQPNVSDPLHASEDSRIIEHLRETHPEHLDIEAHKEQFELLNKNLDSLKDNLAVLRGRIDLLQNYLALNIKTENDSTSTTTYKIDNNTQSNFSLCPTSSTPPQSNVTFVLTPGLNSTHPSNVSVLVQQMINESLSSEKNISKRKIDTGKPLTISSSKDKPAGTKPLRENIFNSIIPETDQIQANKSKGINETISLKTVDPETLWSSFATIIDSVAALKRMMDDNIWNHNRGVLHVLRGHPFVGDGQELQNMDPVSGRELCNELLRKLDSMIETDGRSEEDDDLNENYEHEAARMLVDSFVRVLDATFALKTIMDSRAQKRGVGTSAVIPTGDTIISVNEESISTQSSEEHSTATSIKGQFTLNKLANLSSALAGSATEAETSTNSPKTPTSKNDMPTSTTVRKNAKGVSVKNPHTNISDMGDKEISTEKLVTISSTAHQNKPAASKGTPRTTIEVNKTKGRIHHEKSGAGSKIKQNVTKEGVPGSTTAPVEHEATHKQSTVHHKVQDKSVSTTLPKATEHQETKKSTSAISTTETVLYSTLNLGQNEEKDISQTTSKLPHSSEASNLTTHFPKSSLENVTTPGELNSSTDESTVDKVKRALNTTNSSRRRVRVDRSSSTDNESLKMKSFVDSLETLLEDILDTHNLKRDVSNMLGLNEFSDEPISFPLSLESDRTEEVVDVVEITEATAIKNESTSETKTETSAITTQNLENITVITNRSTPEITESASTHHDKTDAPRNHSLSSSSTTVPDQVAQETKSEHNATIVPGPNEHLEHEKSELHSEENHTKSTSIKPVAFVDFTDDLTVMPDYHESEENVSQTDLPHWINGRRMKSNIHGEFQTFDDSKDDEPREPVYKPEKTNMAGKEDEDEGDNVYGAGVNSAYVATVTVPSFLGMLVFSLFCCFCLRNSSWCCRLFKDQPASHVYLVEEHSTD